MPPQKRRHFQVSEFQELYLLELPFPDLCPELEPDLCPVLVPCLTVELPVEDLGEVLGVEGVLLPGRTPLIEPFEPLLWGLTVAFGAGLGLLGATGCWLWGLGGLSK